MEENKNEGIEITNKIADVGNGVSDLGDYPSRTIGNLITGTLTDMGKENIKSQHPDIDYGDLPSGTLAEIGKVIVNEVMTEPKKPSEER